MSRWRQVVRRELHRYCSETGHDVLKRQEFLEQFQPILEAEFPDNRTPGQKFSQVMQQLRDSGEVEFIDDAGTYRILSLDFDPAGERAGTEGPIYEAAEYETTVGARSIPAAFRRVVLDRYGRTCPVSGVDHDRLLDVAHVLSWSEYPDHRTDPGNVLALDRTHHAAFDAGLFTLDGDFRLHVNPDFDTDADVLRWTLLDRAGDRVPMPATATIADQYLDAHNRTLDWW